jgi:flagellar hook-basal body complex protein FliE
MANITEATSAYAAALKQMSQSAGATTATEPADASAFGDMLKQSLQSVVDAQHKSETVSGQALAGKADMTDVLQAVNNAEMALNSVLAIRDKLVNAYDSLMRTQI